MVNEYLIKLFTYRGSGHTNTMIQIKSNQINLQFKKVLPGVGTGQETSRPLHIPFVSHWRLNRALLLSHVTVMLSP